MTARKILATGSEGLGPVKLRKRFEAVKSASKSTPETQCVAALRSQRSIQVIAQAAEIGKCRWPHPSACVGQAWYLLNEAPKDEGECTKAQENWSGISSGHIT